MQTGQQMIAPGGYDEGDANDKVEGAEKLDETHKGPRTQAGQGRTDADAPKNGGRHPQPVIKQGMVVDPARPHHGKLARRRVPGREGEGERNDPTCRAHEKPESQCVKPRT